MPSKKKGCLINVLLAPTNLLISISLFLDWIVILIVFVIKNAVTTKSAITIIYVIFWIT